MKMSIDFNRFRLNLQQPPKHFGKYHVKSKAVQYPIIWSFSAFSLTLQVSIYISWFAFQDPSHHSSLKNRIHNNFLIFFGFSVFSSFISRLKYKNNQKISGGGILHSISGANEGSKQNLSYVRHFILQAVLFTRR